VHALRQPDTGQWIQRCDTCRRWDTCRLGRWFGL